MNSLLAITRCMKPPVNKMFNLFDSFVLSILNYSCNQLLQLCTARTAWSDSMTRSDSVIKLVSVLSVNVLPSWLRNSDQWKPDYRAVTSEKPRN